MVTLLIDGCLYHQAAASGASLMGSSTDDEVATAAAAAVAAGAEGGEEEEPQAQQWALRAAVHLWLWFDQVGWGGVVRLLGVCNMLPYQVGCALRSAPVAVVCPGGVGCVVCSVALVGHGRRGMKAGVGYKRPVPCDPFAECSYMCRTRDIELMGDRVPVPTAPRNARASVPGPGRNPHPSQPTPVPTHRAASGVRALP